MTIHAYPMAFVDVDCLVAHCQNLLKAISIFYLDFEIYHLHPIL